MHRLSDVVVEFCDVHLKRLARVAATHDECAATYSLVGRLAVGGGVGELFIIEDVVVDCTNMAYAAYGASCYIAVLRDGDKVQLTGNTQIINFNSEAAGAGYNVGGTMTVEDTVVLGGTVSLGAGATLVAPAGLTVTTAEGYMVVYSNGVYTSVKCVAKVGDTYYATFAQAYEAVKTWDDVRPAPLEKNLEAARAKGEAK